MILKEKLNLFMRKLRIFLKWKKIVPDQFINDEKIFDFDSKERLVHIKFPDDSESFFDYDTNDAINNFESQQDIDNEQLDSFEDLLKSPF